MRAEVVPASSPKSSTRHECALMRRLQTSCDEAGRELQAVAAAQRLLLPAVLPEVPGLELAVSYRPASQAGGDYYDFLQLPGGRWGLFIADVSGHGAAAAIVAAVVHATLHGCSEAEDPSKLLSYVNVRLRGSREEWSGSFVTAFYAVFDPASGTLSYASAGHPPARVLSGSDGRIRALATSRGLPLGIVTDEFFVTASEAVQAGDVLVLYTDGVTEARGEAGDWFGVERLDESIATNGGSAEGVTGAIVRSLTRFAGGGRPADDQTMVVAVVK
jgi:phosphoserine phosphatase RsbU/P